ncbi:Eco57I restriction-modification methylase domain-containing protein [Phaeobacter italicus]|uniref:Eco57I restriction-modification methylase domain-containing protein n=1 Tax=Phaeobacter italicus TaxID=481446 RepID=UPI0035134F5D
MTFQISHNPDVLTCLANLSNDEVFTPPAFANRMLDELPSALWSNPDAKFLDPFSKTGVFLREIAKRLNEGLRPAFPDDQERLNHILTNQVFGIALTELTALISRRSLYCSKMADGRYSICDVFDEKDGNIIYENRQHTWDGGKCKFCGAAQSVYERSDDLENYAYLLLHHEKPEEIFDVKFDVIIGNPPYQLSDGGHGASAKPIYHKFVEQAKKLQPSYLSMVIPARWYSGGKGLDDFRADMLKDRRMRKLVDYPKLYDAFPGVKIRGGICYFLWEKNHDGMCEVQTMWDGEPLGEPVARYLDQFDVLVRRNEAVSVLEKIQAFRHEGVAEPTFDTVVSRSKPFGFRTNFHGKPDAEGLDDPIKLYGSQKISWIERNIITQNADWIERWKVLMSAVQGTSAAVETKFLSNPIVSGPGEICTETYVVAGQFETEDEAEYCASYLRTRFARFFVSLRKAAQHASRDVYSFVPLVPLDRHWTDQELYQRYELTDEEVEFIEATVAPMEQRR